MLCPIRQNGVEGGQPRTRSSHLAALSNAPTSQTMEQLPPLSSRGGGGWNNKKRG
jgi:hypothetical protein